MAAVKAAGAEAVAIQGDLTTAGAVETLFNDAVAAIGKPDIAINTVGKVLKKPIAETSEAEYDEMSAVNAKSAFFFIKEAGKHLNDNGKLVTLVTSLLGAYTPFYAPLIRHWDINRVPYDGPADRWFDPAWLIAGGRGR